MAPLAEPDDAEEPAAAEEAPPATPRGEKGDEEEEEAEAEEPSSPAGDEPDSPGAKTEELQPLGPDPLESEANRKTYIETIDLHWANCSGVADGQTISLRERSSLPRRQCTQLVPRKRRRRARRSVAPRTRAVRQSPPLCLPPTHARAEAAGRPR